MDRWPTTTPSDPFDRAQRQLLDEERTLRALAEAQVREFRRLVVEFASAFVAEELDARRRADPRFTEQATPADWRQLLRTARQEQTGGVRWPATQRVADEAARWQAEAERLRGEVNRLTAELALRAIQSTPAPELTQGESEVSHDSSRQGPASQLLAQAPLQPSLVKPRPGARAVPIVDSLGLADVRLPALPPVAPARFAGQLPAWPREALALAILAVTGWSMRLAVADQMSAVLGSVKAGAGSLRRTFSLLVKRGYWLERKVVLTGVHAPLPDPAVVDDAMETGPGDAKGPTENTVLVLVRLGDLGRDLLAACGVQPRPSEWELLEAAYGSQAAAEYLGLVCAFTYQVRLRGYATALVLRSDNHANGKTWPVVLMRKGNETLQVTVAGSADGRELKQDEAQQGDRAAFVTLTPDLRDALVAQAQAAGVIHGRATDLQTLFNTQEARGPLWSVEW